MGGRGGSLRGSQGVSVARTAPRPIQQARPQPAQRQQAQATSVSPQALAAQIAGDPGAILRMADDQAVKAISWIFDNVKVEKDQHDTDTQRFLNHIGWDKELPTIAEDAKQYKQLMAATALSATRGTRHILGRNLYHTDKPEGPVRDAKVFADQFQGAGKMYMSGGCYGGGTYWTNDKAHSWKNYGNRTPKSALQIGFINMNARVIKFSQLKQIEATFSQSHPKTYQALINAEQGYWHKKSGKLDGVHSIFAAMHGYNVIDAETLNGYCVTLTRKVMTVEKGCRRSAR